MTYRVMIVEDDSAIAQSLLLALKTLTSPAIDAVRAYSGEEAIRLWAEQPADLLLTDHNMREMSGVELVGHLREQGATQPMLLLTAYDSIVVQLAARNAGVTDFIAKPFFIDQLLDQISDLLRKGSSAQA
jgi:DNA-binding response OmpR family regulator